MRQARKKNAWTKKGINREQFLNFPLELILEVFPLHKFCNSIDHTFTQNLGHFHPIDIYHFGQTDKAFRRLVMTGDGLSIWETTFANDPSLPPCPTSMSKPCWAAFLFGPAICDVNSCP